SSVGSLSSANAAGRIQYLHLSDESSPDEIQKNTFSLQVACCAAITELVLNETNAYQVAQVGRFYSVNLSFKRGFNSYVCSINNFCVHCFSKIQKTLRLSRLFPTDLFEILIDIGHYVCDIRAYEGLVSKLHSLKIRCVKQIAESIENMNQNKASTKHVGNYAVLEHLGSGAFGSVYKV
ncbi:NEK10 kinase, partial [Chloropsis hardwickii]|nr:NEK10 kinase [Chloropsis hardwickii]